MNIHKNGIVYGALGKPMLFDVHYVQDGNAKPVILYVHGFNGFKDWGNFDLISVEFSKAGFVFVKMNLSHNGTTILHPETFADLENYSLNNYSKELYDVDCIINWLYSSECFFKNEIDLSKLSLLGHSRGGGISILKALEDKRVNALITWAAVGACKTPWGTWGSHQIEEWKRNGFEFIENKRTKQSLPLHIQLYYNYQQNEQRFDIEYAIKNLKIPVQMCHGIADEAVSYENVFLNFKKWNPEISFVSVDSNHTFGRVHPNENGIIPDVCLQVIHKNIQFLKNTFSFKSAS